MVGQGISFIYLAAILNSSESVYVSESLRLVFSQESHISASVCYFAELALLTFA